jgi:ATP-dependent Zn protease
MEGALGYVMRASAGAAVRDHRRGDARRHLRRLRRDRPPRRWCFGEVSIGAWNDLQQSNGIVRALVEQYGMSRLGVRVMLEDEDGPQGRRVADSRLHARDQEIDRILAEERDRAERLLKEHEHLHKALVDLLLEKKVLDASSIKSFVSEKKPELSQDASDAVRSTETATATATETNLVDPSSVASAGGAGAE